MQTRSYDTVSEATNDLAKRGYTFDFSIATGEDCIVCNKHEINLSPEEFQIDEIYRFEGQSNPDDESIVFAISSDKFKIKGVVVNAFGMYAETMTASLIEKLSLKMKPTTTPIKRSKALVQFSREHHFGLLLAWKIRKGLKENIEPNRISSYTLFFYESELAAHFEEEEKDLFVKLPDDDPLRKQAFEEHEHIYDLVNGLRNDGLNTTLLKEFADAIDNHIRFEERILFNHLQKHISEEDLAKLEESHSKRKGDFDEKWNDHFYIKK